MLIISPLQIAAYKRNGRISCFDYQNRSQAMLKKRKKKASSSMIDLNLKPLYPTKIATKPDPIRYFSPKF